MLSTGYNSGTGCDCQVRNGCYDAARESSSSSADLCEQHRRRIRHDESPNQIIAMLGGDGQTDRGSIQPNTCREMLVLQKEGTDLFARSQIKNRSSGGSLVAERQHRKLSSWRQQHRETCRPPNRPQIKTYTTQHNTTQHNITQQRIRTQTPTIGKHQPEQS